MDWITKIALILIIVGGLNWGIIGLFNLDIIAFLFGPMSTLSRSIYMLVGMSAVWIAVTYLYTPKEVNH